MKHECETINLTLRKCEIGKKRQRRQVACQSVGESATVIEAIDSPTYHRDSCYTHSQLNDNCRLDCREMQTLYQLPHENLTQFLDSVIYIVSVNGSFERQQIALAHYETKRERESTLEGY